MLRNKAQRLILLYMILASLSGCLLDTRFSYWEENYLYIEDDYEYDVDTILQTIINGEVSQDSFQIYLPSIDDNPPPEYQFWDQDDHLVLAAGFHQWYLNGSTENWSLLKVDFLSSCEKMKALSGGPSTPVNWARVTVHYYKPGVNSYKEVPNRQVNAIILSPNFGILFISESIYNPIPYNPNVDIPELGSLDSKGMKIKAAAALRIAEQAGGNKYDRCTITAVNSLEDEYDGWHITFLVNLSELLEIVVNDQTGEYEILNE